MELTLERLIELEKWAGKNTIKPLRVLSTKQAKNMNKIERLLGTDQRYKVGDRYYRVLIQEKAGEYADTLKESSVRKYQEAKRD
jgi:hypothetical protein